jgi:hypothetical protein
MPLAVPLRAGSALPGASGRLEAGGGGRPCQGGRLLCADLALRPRLAPGWVVPSHLVACVYVCTGFCRGGRGPVLAAALGGNFVPA